MTYINKALKAVKRMNLPDSIVWQSIGAVFAFLLSAVLALTGSRFKRLETKVDDAIIVFSEKHDKQAEKTEENTRQMAEMAGLLKGIAKGLEIGNKS